MFGGGNAAEEWGACPCVVNEVGSTQTPCVRDLSWHSSINGGDRTSDWLHTNIDCGDHTFDWLHTNTVHQVKLCTKGEVWELTFERNGIYNNNNNNNNNKLLISRSIMRFQTQIQRDQMQEFCSIRLGGFGNPASTSGGV